MSNTNNGDPLRPSDPDLVNKIVSDVFKESGFAARKGPQPPTPNEQVILRATAVSEKIITLMRGILQAANQKGIPYSPDSAFATIFKFSEDEFRSWSKDDLLFLVVEIHSEHTLEYCNRFQESLLPPK